MIKTNSITFAIHDGEQPLSIHIEPWATELTVHPKEEKTFLPINPIKDFSWTVI
jgi:hypothetical protein